MKYDAMLAEKESEVSSIITMLETSDLTRLQSAVLKSTVLMMLYNAIESVMTELLTNVHEQISYEKFSDLNRSIQNMMLDFYWKQKRNDKMYDIFNDEEPFPSFDKYTDKINVFSGNLDARKIDEIFKSYGISCLTTIGRDRLLEIKTKRNQLAHGEKTYKSTCRDMTVEEIKKLKDAAYRCLFEMCKNVDDYLTNKVYLRT